MLVLVYPSRYTTGDSSSSSSPSSPSQVSSLPRDRSRFVVLLHHRSSVRPISFVRFVFDRLVDLSADAGSALLLELLVVDVTSVGAGNVVAVPVGGEGLDIGSTGLEVV